jgi:hypothetical protein
MGIFDWWIAVLDFIAKNPENPNPQRLDDILEAELSSQRGEINKIYVQVNIRIIILTCILMKASN